MGTGKCLDLKTWGREQGWNDKEILPGRGKRSGCTGLGLGHCTKCVYTVVSTVLGHRVFSPWLCERLESEGEYFKDEHTPPNVKPNPYGMVGRLPMLPFTRGSLCSFLKYSLSHYITFLSNKSKLPSP